MLRKSAILILMAAILAISGVALAEGHQETRTSQAETAVISSAKKKPQCGELRRGIRFYRQKTWQHEETLGISKTRHETKVWHLPCDYAKWVHKLWRNRAKERRKQVDNMPPPIPVGEFQIRRYIHSILGYAEAECVATIIEWETGGTWEPTIDFGFGHGNTSEAYGLPQALPGTKMKSAGPDWETNPITQIRWMIGYLKGRYGGICAGYEVRKSRGWY